MLNDSIGKVHFWITFLGTYIIYFPMHYLGFIGTPRRYFDNLGVSDFYPLSAHYLNDVITIVALVVGVSQSLYIFNLIYSYFRGEKAGPNPWGAASLEWYTPQTPPEHGNWGPTLPTVHRWAYDYGVPEHHEDFIPQVEPVKQN